MKHIFYLSLLVFVYLSGPLGAWAQVFINDSPLKNASNALSVVEVLGTLKGSGVIVLYDGRPVVLTNSHVLQGKKSADMTLPERVIGYSIDSQYDFGKVGLWLKVKVIFDDPLTDFAILDFDPSELSEFTEGLLRFLGERNGQLCRETPRCSGWRPGPGNPEFNNFLATVLDGKKLSVPLRNVDGPGFDRFNPKKNKQEILLPIYARPGMSGGAYYERGILTGLMSKVSLVGEPFGIAIPLKRIGQVLADKKAALGQARWSSDGLSVDLKLGQLLITSGNNGGGETGHGGGETGHGGGETGHGGSGPEDDYWLMRTSDAAGEHDISTWNPFKIRNSSFKLNGQEVLYFLEKDKMSLPTLEKFSSKSQIVYATEAERLKLDKLRLENSFKLYQGRYFDLIDQRYVINKYFEWYSTWQGAQWLLPDDSGRWAVKNLLTSGAVDQDGYYFSHPFAAKNETDALFDLRLSVPDIGGPEDLLYIKASKDFATLTLSRIGKNFLPMHATLKRVPLASATTILLEDPESKTKAVYIYDADDLLKIERVYIQTPEILLEFGSSL